MDTQVDLGPAAAHLAALVKGVADEQLALPTPCREYPVEVLLQHIDGLSLAFTAGGVDLPGPVAAMVAADELVIHGWDLARATGQAFECDPGALGLATQFVEAMSAPGESREGLFGPAIPVPDGASELERVIALSGRDPHWTTAG